MHTTLTDLEQKKPNLVGWLAVIVIFCMASGVVCQNLPKKPVENGGVEAEKTKPAEKLDALQRQTAIELLRSQGDDLRKAFDNPEAIALTARIADLLWTADEAYARMLFRRAFEAASAPVENISSVDTRLREQQLAVARRKAAALAEVLRLLGKHDEKTAADLLAKYESDKLDKDRRKENSNAQFELLAQIALELAQSKPEQAQQFGVLSLAGPEIPEATGQLLFALSRHGKQYGDAIFTSAVSNLRRNGYRYNNVLNALCNYAFFNDGKVVAREYQDDGAILIAFFLEAAQAQLDEWRQSNPEGAKYLSRSSASFYQFMVARVVPIIKVNAPDKGVTMAAMLQNLSTGLSQQQVQDAADLAQGAQQQRKINDSLGSGLDDRIARAENERDVVVRDALWRSIAIGIMRGDSERALSIAAKIDDLAIRNQTEDDIRLVISADRIRSQNSAEARKGALALHDLALRARALAAIATANRASRNQCDTDLLDEAYSIALKDETRPEKVSVVLSLARQFYRCGADRGFDLLSNAITIANRLPSGEPEKSSLTAKRPGVEAYTVVGGQELTTGHSASRDSLSFEDAAAFTKRDFIQAQNLGYQIDDRVLRAKYFMAVAQSVLQTASDSDRH